MVSFGLGLSVQQILLSNQITVNTSALDDNQRTIVKVILQELCGGLVKVTECQLADFLPEEWRTLLKNRVFLRIQNKPFALDKSDWWTDVWGFALQLVQEEICFSLFECLNTIPPSTSSSKTGLCQLDSSKTKQLPRTNLFVECVREKCHRPGSSQLRQKRMRRPRGRQC